MGTDPDEDDPWAFLPTTRPEPIAGGTRRRSGVPDPFATDPEVGAAPEPARVVQDSPTLPESPTRRDQPKQAEPQELGPQPKAPEQASAPDPQAEELSEAVRPTLDHPNKALRSRARPLALALAATSLAGLLTEVVGNSQLITLAGANSLLVLYPLSGLGLLAVALVQFRDLDARARLAMLRNVNLGFAALLGVALLAIAADVGRAAAIALVWLCADQLTFLLPLLIWAAAGDEFNVAEGRRIFGWMIAWTYFGQFLGLAIATVTPPLFDRVGLQLYWLLALDPIICLALGLWLPRALAHAATSAGLREREGMRSALRGAWEFIWGIPAWRALFGASLFALVAGMCVHLTYTMGVGLVLGADAARLQVLFASMNLLALGVAWVISRRGAERLLERLGIPGSLMILPVATVVAAASLAVGSWQESLALLIAGVTIWRIPRMSIDESARRAALTLVPDQRRARVSFLVTLGPIGLGLVISGAVAGLGVALGQFWVGPVIAGFIALAALPFSIATIRRWDDSLLSWRVRRRKVMRHF